MLVFTIVCTFFLSFILPIYIQKIFYIFSVFIKELLFFLLPFIIFALLFNSIIKIGSNITAIKMILLLIVFVICSNFISTILAYISNKLILFKITTIFDNVIISDSSYFNFSLNFPKLIPSELSLLVGILFGLFFSYKYKLIGNITANILNVSVMKFLNKIFVPIMPLFIMGFVFKLQYENMLIYIIKNYLFVFIFIFIIQFVYIMFLFCIGLNFNLSLMYKCFKNIFPAMIMGFSSMSSVVAMPATLIAVKKNTKSSNLFKIIVPITINIHLIGDCIAIPILALVILHSYGYDQPTFLQYLIFTIYFVTIKFAVVAIPAGGILVLLPVLEKAMGLNVEMLSLITTMYIIFDPFVTSMNVFGNNIFAILFDKIYSKF